MKKALIYGFVTLIFLASTVLLWFAAQNSQPEYEEVQATVDSIQKEKRYTLSGKSHILLHVICYYDGKYYALQNVEKTWLYPQGRQFTAYLSGGKLYPDIEGIKTATPADIAFFVSLFLSVILLGRTLYLSVIIYKQKKADQAKQQSPWR